VLAGTVKQVLSNAIERGGTTLRDFLSADGEPGYFQLDLLAYERKGEPCRKCGTRIKRLVIGQRSSYYCPRCQR
jgi:formamidopyrimidine-DNA glycosylase